MSNDLSADVKEQLKSRNLYSFVILSDTNFDKITFLVYENERWSSMMQQWGNVVGVHLYQTIAFGDRRPFTDETGRIQLR
jgi:hypothetical protein